MREKETAVRDRYTVMITLLCMTCLALLILIAFALSKPEEEQHIPAPEMNAEGLCTVTVKHMSQPTEAEILAMAQAMSGECYENEYGDMAITALAGPVSNVLICCIVLFIYGLIFLPCKLSGSSFLDSVLNMVYITAYLSIALAIFNIIPIPPLDGSKVLFSLMSDESYYKLMRYEHYGMIILLVLIASDVLGAPLQMVTQAVFKFLFAFAEWGFSLSRILFY